MSKVSKNSILLIFSFLVILGKWSSSYYFFNDWKGAWMPPGLASYAINPQGAKRLIDTVKTQGCEQGDMTVNSYNVRLQYAAPDYFSVADNLSMSKGF